MSNEGIQLSAEYEEYNAKIENAKSDEEAEAILKEYFPNNAEGLANGRELSEAQLESVTGGTRFTVKHQGVPIFNDKMKIIGLLNKGAIVNGSFCSVILSPMKGLFGLIDRTRWIKLDGGGFVNFNNLLMA